MWFGPLAYIHKSNSSLIRYINKVLYNLLYSINKTSIKVIYGEQAWERCEFYEN